MPPLEEFQWILEEKDTFAKRLNSFHESLSDSASFWRRVLTVTTQSHLRTFAFGTLSDYERYALAAFAALLCLVLWKLLRPWRSQLRRRSVGRANRRRTSSGSSIRTTRSHLASLDSLLDIPLFGQAQRAGGQGRMRSRSGSQSSLDWTSVNEGEHDDLFELLAVERSSSQDNPMKRIKYYGPTQFALVYESLVPPPSWLEVSRQVIPPDKHFRLQRYLALTLSRSATLGIHHATVGHTPEAAQAIAHRPLLSMPYTVAPKKSQEKEPPIELPLEDVSLQVANPVQSGVIHIYVKDTPREEWMEHTLPSAAFAAQFQTDLLAMQVLGPTIYDMFQALQLIHQGSIACKGKEFVWHDKEAIGNDPNACDDNLLAQSCYEIAWDDCLRCFGSAFPSLRLRLEALWWKHTTEHMSKDAIKLGENAPT